MAFPDKKKDGNTHVNIPCSGLGECIIACSPLTPTVRKKSNDGELITSERNLPTHTRTHAYVNMVIMAFKTHKRTRTQ